MKKILFFFSLVLCFALTDRAHAQRALSDMRGLEIRSGMVDGFHSKDKHNELGYYFGAAMTTYTRNANKWVFGAEFLHRYYPYKDGRLPLSQFTGEGGYYYKFLSDHSKTVFFSIGASALAGYETINWGEKLLYDGATIRNEDNFLYGGAITLEMEVYLADRIILLLSGRERALWGTSADKFHFQFGFGLKYIIN
ncbi:conjugal transfer protein TraO [Bacteroides sp. 224]|uniref:conjugal transfer protein TraO n=1 Tax=Bacteroides sp. 224 TaxID=2302936 RepID=UPI0013D5C835|nr:conjugal transfer protein TraO [Bacteroides sp. 224]NDV64686.1 conjugal transfer protein TraO [Bacteroides sp. 224]